MSEEKLAARNERQRQKRPADPERYAAEMKSQTARLSAIRRDRREGGEWRHARRTDTPTALALRIEAEQRASGLGLDDLTTMAVRTDPYRLDTRVGHRDGQWVRDHMVPDSEPTHVRGIHYGLVGRVILPTGLPYVNDEKTFKWIGEAVKAARWLGYLDFGAVDDHRNDDPLIFVPEIDGEPTGRLMVDVIVQPASSSLAPYPVLHGAEVRQPYRLVIIGEKSSLRAELEPVARELGSELTLPSGELSDTLIYGMVRHAAADGRPTAIFYLSDFDPSGHVMGATLGRKLQAHRDRKFPDLVIQVHTVALTVEQCIEFDLPSTPLKATELRADGWRAKYGREQTELDAMLVRHPGEIARIARKAAAPFFDPTLRRRVFQATSAWHRDAERLLDESDEYQTALAKIGDEVASLREAIRRIGLAQLAASDAGPAMPAVVLPEPEIHEIAPDALFARVELGLIRRAG